MAALNPINSESKGFRGFLSDLWFAFEYFSGLSPIKGKLHLSFGWIGFQKSYMASHTVYDKAGKVYICINEDHPEAAQKFADDIGGTVVFEEDFIPMGIYLFPADQTVEVYINCRLFAISFHRW
jgi:hypothetical protein